MTTDSQTPETTAIVEHDPEASKLAETSTPATPTLQSETEALVEAIKRRAQAEVQAAETLTREAYLNAIKQARANIEQTKLIDPDQIEASILHLQQDAERNWNAIAQEIQSFGDRLSEAAKAAWETLTQGSETK